MFTKVLETPRASQQAGGLRRKAREGYERFLDMLEAEGCGTLQYRLTGDPPIEHLCVKHLGGSLRVVVGFEDPRKAWVILVGVHAQTDPGIDIYTELYRLAGLDRIPEGKRTKPSCCDLDGAAPFMANEIMDLVERARMLRRRSR